MTYNLRSSGHEMNVSIDDAPSELDTLEKLLVPFEQNVNGLHDSLKEIRAHFENKLERHRKTIANLLTRMESMENRMSYFEHSSYLQGRKLDDLEQVSRKNNLKLCGIGVDANDTPDILMKAITDEYLGKEGIDLKRCDFDRCHRVGRKYKRDDKLCQDVLLRMCSWNARNTIYKNRKRFRFFIKADLTTRRQDILNYARNEASESSDDSVGRTVDYVFADENCKLKLKSKNGKYFTFSSELEFSNLVTHLDQELLSSPEFIADEKTELFY